MGPEPVRLPRHAAGEAVCPDGAAPHQLRAHAEPHPAGGGQLRGSVPTQRGRAAAAAPEALQQQRDEKSCRNRRGGVRL